MRSNHRSVPKKVFNSSRENTIARPAKKNNRRGKPDLGKTRSFSNRKVATDRKETVSRHGKRMQVINMEQRTIVPDHRYLEKRGVTLIGDREVTKVNSRVIAHWA